MRGVAVFIEERKGVLHHVGLELLSEVKHLLQDKARLYALFLTSSATSENLNQITQAGADEIIVVEHANFATYDTAYFAHALSEVEKAYQFDVLLLGSTLIGRDLAPRLSARLHTGLTADATSFEFKVNEKIELYATRPALGGNLFATITCLDSTPQMATVRPGVFSIKKDENHESVLTNFKVSFSFKSQVRVLESRHLPVEEKDLSKAKIIVAGGRGVATKFSELKKIANLLGGETAASRAVVDANVVSRKRLVGQTGQSVKPDVYLAFGISGAIQHVTGMEKSELIIAVNNDPNALIFEVADVGIISDAHAVMPLLIKKLESLV